MRLEGKVAIVTGGAHGFGKAYVMGYAREGAKVVIADVDFSAAKANAEVLEAEGKEALALKTDVSNVADTLDMAKKTAARFGRIDILVNNAAVFGRVKISRMTPFHELSLEEWDQVMAVNITGAFLCCRAVFPYMKTQRSGKIINISSGQFLSGAANMKYAHYVTSKGAVIGLTRALARELGEYNINVNCLAPGSTLTEDPDDQAAVKIREKAIATRCLRRIEYPEDAVGTAIFLASADSDFVTGQTIGANGGSVFF